MAFWVDIIYQYITEYNSYRTLTSSGESEFSSTPTPAPSRRAAEGRVVRPIVKRRGVIAVTDPLSKTSLLAAGRPGIGRAKTSDRNTTASDGGAKQWSPTIS